MLASTRVAVVRGRLAERLRLPEPRRLRLRRRGGDDRRAASTSSATRRAGDASLAQARQAHRNAALLRGQLNTTLPASPVVYPPNNGLARDLQGLAQLLQAGPADPRLRAAGQRRLRHALRPDRRLRRRPRVQLPRDPGLPGSTSSSGPRRPRDDVRLERVRAPARGERLARHRPRRRRRRLPRRHEGLRADHRRVPDARRRPGSTSTATCAPRATSAASTARCSSPGSTPTPRWSSPAPTSSPRYAVVDAVDAPCCSSSRSPASRPARRRPARAQRRGAPRRTRGAARAHRAPRRPRRPRRARRRSGRAACAVAAAGARTCPLGAAARPAPGLDRRAGPRGAARRAPAPAPRDGRPGPARDRHGNGHRDRDRHGTGTGHGNAAPARPAASPSARASTSGRSCSRGRSSAPAPSRSRRRTGARTRTTCGSRPHGRRGAVEVRRGPAALAPRASPGGDRVQAAHADARARYELYCSLTGGTPPGTPGDSPRRGGHDGDDHRRRPVIARDAAAGCSLCDRPDPEPGA